MDPEDWIEQFKKILARKMAEPGMKAVPEQMRHQFIIEVMDGIRKINVIDGDGLFKSRFGEVSVDLARHLGRAIAALRIEGTAGKLLEDAAMQSAAMAYSPSETKAYLSGQGPSLS